MSKYTAFLARTSSPLTVYGYDRGVPQSLLTGNDTGRKKDVKNRTSTKGSIVIDINSNSDGAKGNANDANSTAAKQMTEKEGENDEHDVDAFDPSVLTLLSSILDAPAAAFTKLIKEQDPRSVSSSNVSESATEYEVNIGGVDAEKDTHVVALSPAKTVSENSAVSPTSAGPASLASPTSPVSALIEQAQKLKRKQQQKQQQQQQRLQRMNFDGASSGRSEIATVTADCSLFDLIRKLCGIHAYSCTPRTQVWVVESPPKKPRPVGVVRVVDVLQLLSPQRNHFF